MRASLSVLAAILGAAQLAAAGTQGENAQAARIARDGFYKCAQMTVPDYDDGISPANVVAKAIAAKCRSWVDAMSKYETRAEAVTLYNEIKRGEEGNLLGIVLRHRVLKSNAAPVVTGERLSPRQPVRSAQRRTAPKPSAP